MSLAHANPPRSSRWVNFPTRRVSLEGAQAGSAGRPRCGCSPAEDRVVPPGTHSRAGERARTGLIPRAFPPPPSPSPASPHRPCPRGAGRRPAPPSLPPPPGPPRPPRPANAGAGRSCPARSGPAAPRSSARRRRHRARSSRRRRAPCGAPRPGRGHDSAAAPRAAPRAPRGARQVPRRQRCRAGRPPPSRQPPPASRWGGGLRPSPGGGGVPRVGGAGRLGGSAEPGAEALGQGEPPAAGGEAEGLACSARLRKGREAGGGGRARVRVRTWSRGSVCRGTGQEGNSRKIPAARSFESGFAWGVFAVGFSRVVAESQRFASPCFCRRPVE